MAAHQPNVHTTLISTLLQKHDFYIGCGLCCKQEITVSFDQHHCHRDMLFAKEREGYHVWLRVSDLPSFPNPKEYFVCKGYKEGNGCDLHGQRCTFAKSSVEAVVWNFLKQNGFSYSDLISLIRKEKGFPLEPTIHANHQRLKEQIQSQFPGKFIQVCKTCFHSKRQRAVLKGSTITCSYTQPLKHRWEPTMVLHNGNIFTELRPKPNKSVSKWWRCKYAEKGEQCVHGAQCCWFAHSKLEIIVWSAESQGFDRSELLTAVRQQGPKTPVSSSQKRQYNCNACEKQFYSRGDLMNHCNDLSHSTRMEELNSVGMGKWKHRHPPQTNQTYRLCERASTCELGSNCVDAHSQEELREWHVRDKMKRKTVSAAEDQGVLSYQDSLLREYRGSMAIDLIMSETLPGTTVECDKDLVIFGHAENKTLEWKFKIQSKRPIMEVALLKQLPEAFFSLDNKNPELCTYASGQQFYNTDTMTYDITVTFKSSNPGLYEQWLVCDLDMRPVLLQKLKVRVGKMSDPQLMELPESHGHPCQECERWHGGNREIIPCLYKTDAQEELLKEFKPPQMSLQFNSPEDISTPMNHLNYKDRMHNFLYNEEHAEDSIVARLSVQGKITLSTTLDDSLFGMKIAPQGELFGAISVPYTLTPDTPEGAVLKHDVQSALIAPIQSNKQSTKVYEAIILRDTTIGNKMHFKLSNTCCSELSLQSNNVCEMEIQFRLNRLKFCEMHKAVDLLPDMDRVLPDLNNTSVLLGTKEYEGLGLNSKQQVAMNIIVGEACERGTEVPFLIYGPFGTGKTFTLATATKELVKKPTNRVLICTHTNSSADLYVKKHFHSSVNSGRFEVKPLRIKAEEASVKSTDKVTLQYCHLSEDKQSFSFPDEELLASHRVVITTTAMARHLHDLKLPIGYFTHILIDEASQMLECEALMPLGLAGPNTRVVLAGDHMQMGPKLFSVDVHQRSNHTLLNRLFHYYQGQHSDAASKSRIIFNENYRSTKEIVEFVSTHFYVGKSDVIKAVGNVPSHPSGHSLKFHHVRGECELDTTSMSWFNVEEVEKVVEIVEDLLRDWPSTWEPSDPSSICVLSEGHQVLLIRNQLRKRHLHAVTVENIANVQGKQFRVIIMSAIQTGDSLRTLDTPGLDLLNDARVLNTTITRAQSQVVVVGDAAALCYFGKSSRFWESYIHYCINKQSAHPQFLTKDFLKQEVREISRFSKQDKEDNSDSESSTSEIPDIEDPILKELLDEDKDVRVDVTAEGLLDVLWGKDNVEKVNRHEGETKQENYPLEPVSLQRDPSNYKHCTLIMEQFGSGYAIPLDEPSSRIHIKGRTNLAHSFPGDQVHVEIFNNGSHPPEGRVLSVVNADYGSKTFVCTVDNYDPQVMTPINNCISKIYTPFWKDKPNHIAVRTFEGQHLKVERFEKINEELKRNKLFVVQVLKWRDQFRYPLGVVVKVLPRVTSLDAGLEVLDIEYKLQRGLPSSIEKDAQIFKDLKADVENRMDCREFITFTIDPAHSEDLDDAISVRDLGKHYEIGVHIADVASFVAKDCSIDKYARQNGTTFYPPTKEPFYMFPKGLSTNNFSLLPDFERNVISLMVKIDKSTNSIKDSRFALSVIRSDKKLSYEEAENILQNSTQGLNTLEGCLNIAYTFSEVHRKARKQDDWYYKTPDEDVVIGRRQSHKMVEELMVMYNHAVTVYLLSNAETASCTPVRCQEKPNTEQLRNLKAKFDSIIPLSIHFTHCMVGVANIDQNHKMDRAVINETLQDLPQNTDLPNTFSVLTSVIKCLDLACKDVDIHRIVDLLATDDIYPQLQPLVYEFRKSIHKAHVLRSNTSHLSRIGHYDLQLDSYTWASSPIRRYVDIVVQRLLHSVVDRKAVEYTPHEIDQSCLSFSDLSDQQKKYERKAHPLSLASQLNVKSARMIAFVIDVSPAGKSLKLSFPLNRQSLPNLVPVLYRDMQLADQPEYIKEDNSVLLKWMRRVYSFTNENIRTELQHQRVSQSVMAVPTKLWKSITLALKDEDWDAMLQGIKMIRSTDNDDSQEIPHHSLTKDRTSLNPDHFVELSLRLKPGETVEVQLGTDTERGLLVPVVQMLIVCDKFEICLEHTKNPTQCFSKYALHSSSQTYDTYMDYQKIWKPLCEMESASNAVAENDSIVIDNVQLTWKQIPGAKKLCGSFQMPLDKVELWTIKCNLKQCLLCIRLRDQNLGNKGTQNHKNVDLMNIPSLIWVAHGVTTKVTDEEKAKDLTYIQIDFRINHMSMDRIPDSIYWKDSKFTVELIPKLLPDVRKEDAVTHLTEANHLVKAIALGKKTNSVSVTAFRIPVTFEIAEQLAVKFPELNLSQVTAIREALKKQFTLIQGPPGTGKTIVGVHLAYWFFKLNQYAPTHELTTTDDSSPPRRCILYCGPSNKSVDVVAGQLLKLKDVLKPLRVYSDQMEMLEFPYPGSNLKLSRRSVREGKPNKELSPITLHHLIRKPENPFSCEILSFDERISKEENLSDEEIKSYQKLLSKARKHELMLHDVILCTCTAASNPNFAKLHIEQIIIDECAMATEPESFIPLVTHKPEKIVLLGDHKQLQPTVHCDLVARLGMRKSLFERYMDKALMLDTQYRMHEGICEFPSKQFYNGRLKTNAKRRASVLLKPSAIFTPILFGHVAGTEISLVVSTEWGNENSMANIEEAKQAVHIASLLINKARVQVKDIAILTPYNAQVSKINETLTENGLLNVNVSTITKSQGSEWRYVILSTVRSCPGSEIDKSPTKAWLTKRLGFIMDPNQVNVAITRAKEGLCIIGNKELLSCSWLWKNLLRHYHENGCVVDHAKDIQVQNPGAKPKYCASVL
ncbi:3'-5' exoribonuclease HELZ2 [Osmerus mordax]|uniref:3'-5' exoribonuclease HELZ2 n=1 Tax=Osmerus mordax TaxID=8014 RepID=UPI00350F9797